MTKQISRESESFLDPQFPEWGTQDADPDGGQGGGLHHGLSPFAHPQSMGMFRSITEGELEGQSRQDENWTSLFISA